MAEVWLAEDLRLGRQVAVKVLHASFSDVTDAETVAAFEREARVIARLQHPNIVGVFDAGTVDGRRYIVTEYVRGPSLRQLLDGRGPLREDEVLRIGLQVASALQYAHAQGILHCDVKPENILIDAAGSAKLADFGVAETVTRTLAPSQARDLLGTLAYLAPEVIHGAQPSPRSDVYSLALTLYEAVAGRLPFEGATPGAIAGQRLAMEAPPLRSKAPAASAGLEATLGTGLAIDPGRRFPDAGTFADALRRASGGGPRPARQAVQPPANGPLPPARSHHTTARVARRVAPAPPPQGGVSGYTVLVILGVVLGAVGAGIVVAALLAGGDEDGAGPLPTPSPAPTVLTATATAQDTPTPTATAEPSPSPSPSPTRTATPTRTPATDPSPEPTATQPGPEVTPTPPLPETPATEVASPATPGP